jgi:hypothetical protein
MIHDVHPGSPIWIRIFFPDPGVKKSNKNKGSRIRNTDTWAEPEMLRMADVLCDSSAMLPLQLLVIKKYHHRILYGTPMDKKKFYQDAKP